MPIHPCAVCGSLESCEHDSRRGPLPWYGPSPERAQQRVREHEEQWTNHDLPLLRVACPACGAAPGSLCISAPPNIQGEPVTIWGVHQRRVMAQLSRPSPTADQEKIAAALQSIETKLVGVLERIATALERLSGKT